MWSPELELQRTVEMEGCLSNDRSAQKRHIKMWVTDAISLPNVHKMAISTTKREIFFYDLSTPTYSVQYHLCGELLFCFCLFLLVSNFCTKTLKIFYFGVYVCITVCWHLPLFECLFCRLLFFTSVVDLVGRFVCIRLNC